MRDTHTDAGSSWGMSSGGCSVMVEWVVRERVKVEDCAGSEGRAEGAGR